jgi:hypothetical protein
MILLHASVLVTGCVLRSSADACRSLAQMCCEQPEDSYKQYDIAFDGIAAVLRHGW